ncbi:MAG: DNA-3-methyladenine glycosylase I [Gemmatimonadota bacterium]|nr:DNA-3-methyladenine glycosylase I [Gemmatimonadota bacterium]
MTRCPWCESSDRMRRYHDEEWGVPLHDDHRHFEFLVLDAFQAGLSWSTILNKREHFRRAFHGFDPARIARYTSRSTARLLADPGIVRNRQKIVATIGNARAFLDVQARHGSFDTFIWGFVDGRPRPHRWSRMQQVPATSADSDRMSAALKELGFRFVGSTICYAYMQAAGMVNDHLVGCFRYAEVTALAT